MKQTVVRSYIRASKEPNTEIDNTVGIVVSGAVVILLGVVYWNITVSLLLVAGAIYGATTIAASNPRIGQVEAVTQAPEASQPTAKRHYQHRITVNNYQGKSIKI